MRRLALLVAGLLLATPAPAGAADATDYAACLGPGERFAASGAEAVLTETTRKRVQVWRACDLANGRRFVVLRTPIRRSHPRERVVAPSIAGTKIAWGEVSTTKYGTESGIAVRDARAPAFQRRISVATNYTDETVRQVAIDAAGQVAYANDHAVYVVDAAGTSHRLDRSRPGFLVGLRFADGELRWAHGGLVRRAPASAPPAEEPHAIEGRMLDRQRAGRFDAAEDIDGVVTVVDRSSGARRTVAIPIANRWQLAEDGTVIEIARRALVAHRVDGTRTELAAVRRRPWTTALDDTLGRLFYRVGSGSAWQSVAYAGPAPEAARWNPGCWREGDTFVDGNDDLVIVSRVAGRGEEPPVAYRACAWATGRRVLVSRDLPSEGNGPGAFELAGTTVAFSYSGGTRYDQETSVAVLDATDPRSRRDSYVPGAPEELIAAPGGRAAARTTADVLVLGPEGARRVDVGVPGSLAGLAIEDGTVRWTHAGAPLSVPLALPPACVSPELPYRMTQTAEAVVSWGSGPARATLCRFSGGGPVDLQADERAQLAGGLVGVPRRGADGLVVHVLDVATLQPARPPLAIGERWWALLADGTVVTAAPYRPSLQVHRPDGTTTKLPVEAYPFVGVDQAARTLVIDPQTGLVPVPIP